MPFWFVMIMGLTGRYIVFELLSALSKVFLLEARFLPTEILSLKSQLLHTETFPLKPPLPHLEVSSYSYISLLYKHYQRESL